MSSERLALIVHGELSNSRWTRLLRALRNAELSLIELSDEQLESALQTKEQIPDRDARAEMLERQGVPVLSEVTRREQFLTREHFEEFGKELYANDPNCTSIPKSVSSVFNACIDRPRVDPDPNAPFAGLEVKPRSEVGYAPYVLPFGTQHSYSSKIASQYVIEAGSLIDLGTELATQPTAGVRAAFVVALAHKLYSQLAER